MAGAAVCVGALSLVEQSGTVTARQPLDDSLLVAHSQSGDQSAYAELYQRHHQHIYALCWRMCAGDRALAEDMLQEAFVQGWRKLHLFRGEAAFSTWLHRVAVNVVLGDKRRQSRRLQLVENDEDRPAPESSESDWQGSDNDIENAIARLPERARQVLVLFAIEGYSHEEISQQTGMAVGSSKAQLHRARGLLKEWLAA